ncbi:hypothetical protein [Synechococcus sp. PCC 7336]|uniref:hypothetical protein n=1 Tax=Synechococcus sp. PCC 7336 TaxID=195250 RepID=UPI0012EA75EA|nr:hypothetical protein [Synechococcus sp. PCC 7336]
MRAPSRDFNSEINSFLGLALAPNTVTTWNLPSGLETQTSVISYSCECEAKAVQFPAIASSLP